MCIYILLTSVVTLTMKEHSLIAATRVDLTDLFTERYMYISQSYTLGGELKDSEIHVYKSVIHTRRRAKRQRDTCI